MPRFTRFSSRALLGFRIKRSGFYVDLVNQLVNPNAHGTSDGDNYGFTVSMSGPYAAVSAPNESDPGGITAGKVYVYDVSTETLLATLDNPTINGTSDGDNFGWSVSIQGNYIIVGAPNEVGADGDFNTGAAYVFTTVTGDWTDASLLYSVSNPNNTGDSVSDQFGYSVDINSDYFVISAWRDKRTTTTDQADSGRVYIYSTSTGILSHTIINPSVYGTSEGDHFGNSVSISGTSVVIGANSEDDATNTDTGAVYLYDLASGLQQHVWTNWNAYDALPNSDYFGEVVSASGNYIAVGVPYETGADGPNTGIVYIYDATTYDIVAEVPNRNYNYTDQDLFGYSVHLMDNYLIVGAPGTKGDNPFTPGYGSTPYEGAVYIYKTYTGDWTDPTMVRRIANPLPQGSTENTWFGLSVAISANYCLVGNSESPGGSLYLYSVQDTL